MWRKLILRDTDAVAATSGACATIASDALMNPFDGEELSSIAESILIDG